MQIPDNFNINSRRLDYLYTNLMSATFGGWALSIVIYFTLYGEVNNEMLLFWLVTNTILSIFRLRTYVIYKKETITEKNLKKYKILYTSFLFLSGVVWASLSLFLFPSSVALQLLVTLIVAGLTTGSILSLASSQKIYFMFFGMVILPLSYSFAMGDATIKYSILTTVFIYIVFLSVVSMKIFKITISRMILATQNEALIEELQQKVDEANMANEAKSKFLSVMSHEIRTPLNAIVGFVKILKKSEEDNEKLKYLDTVDRSSFLLMSVINDILDVSKIESGNFSIESIEYEPKKELEHLFGLYSVTASQNGVTLINSISKELPEFVKGDMLRLKQIVSNLLSNAIKFTPKEKAVELIAKYNRQKEILYIEVRDEGIGIAQEDLEKITEEFAQADSSTARKYGGTGLGLSIVTKLLELQNSKLKIESKLGVGSHFSFELKVAQVMHHNTQEDEDELSFNGKTVLVAEDNMMNQMLIEILLEDLEIRVKMASDGEEALQSAKEKRCDLILMDINMPNMNGTDAMRAIKEFDTDTPIVALTANSISGDREKYLGEGFDEYLSKPIDLKSLHKVLKLFFRPL